MKEKTKMKQLILEEFGKSGVEISEAKAEKFTLYAEMLVEYNEKMNLTAITEPHEIVTKHFLDSLLPLGTEKIFNGAACADVGTGAGFPGVPIAIMRDDVSMTLMDSLRKRTAFLDVLISELGLKNCMTVTIRAEDAGKSALRESFDVVLSRAVAPLTVLTELCLPLVACGGHMLALKSRNLDNENNVDTAYAVKLLGGDDFETFGTHERNVFIVKKINPTPPSYPRRAGMPEKRPIKA